MTLKNLTIGRCSAQEATKFKGILSMDLNEKTLGAKRLVERMTKLGINGVEITNAIGASSGQISQWRSGIKSIKGKYQAPLAKLLKCDPEWLAGGNGPDPSIIENVGPAPDIEMVPLIGYTTAGQFTHVEELPEYEVDEWYPSIKRLHGKGFALKIIGDSMTSPTGKSYPDGCIGIFDAGNRCPENKDLVLVKLKGSDEITFKQYVNEDGHQFLRPLNPTYPPIMDEFKVLAVFVHGII